MNNKSKINRIIIITLIIIVILLFSWCIAFGIDYYRCLNLKKPIFCIEDPKYSMETVYGPEVHTFRGIGYCVTYSSKR